MFEGRKATLALVNLIPVSSGIKLQARTGKEEALACNVVHHDGKIIVDYIGLVIITGCEKLLELSALFQGSVER